jgi:hypothetical protein
MCLVLALGTLLMSGADIATAVGPPFDPLHNSFCEPTEPVEDFGLSALPPTDEAPADGDLPFGPKTVSMSVDAGPIIAVGGGVRFDLRSINYFGRTPLEWVMRDRLRPLDAAGNPGAVISQGKRRIHFINAKREDKLILYPPRTPGFYRYETEISGFDGKRLALYARDFRVERKFWDVRFGLNRAVFYPGNHVLSRIENFGTLSPAFGEEFGLQHLTAGEWQTISIPGRDGWLLWAGFALPGMPGQCSSLGLPRDFAPGHYRIVKEWQKELSRDAPIHYLSATFEVRGR